MVEHVTRNDEIVGSIPTAGLKKMKKLFTANLPTGRQGRRERKEKIMDAGKRR